MKTTDINSPLAAAQLVKSTLNDLHNQRQAIEAEEITLLSDKKALKGQPVPLNDIKQAMFDYIDAKAKEFLSDGKWIENLKKFIYIDHNIYTPLPNSPKPQAITYDEIESLRQGAPGGSVFPITHGHPKLVVPDVYVAEATDLPWLFFFGDAIKAKIATCFDEGTLTHQHCDLDKIGVPVAERTRLIEAIDARLDELMKERTRIDRQIAELSV